MAMALSRPATAGSRPAYLDNLYRDTQRTSMHSKSSSVFSNYSNSSSQHSTTSPSDFRGVQPTPRARSPPSEDDTIDDKASVRSFKSNFTSKSRFRSILNRRTYPQIKETVDDDDDDEPLPSDSRAVSRRPSLPLLQTALSSPPQKSHKRKPLPVAPKAKAEELKCQRCYYFHARNCNGYVLGGDHGDACETCAQAGFFGAP